MIKYMIKYIVCMIVVFGTGFVVAMQLATMYPNPSYAASWGKVAFALILFVFFSGLGWGTKTKA